MTTNEDARRADRFRRALRWYPASWRREHEDVLLGILLDEADHTGRSRPSPGQQFTLAVGGLRHRLRSPAGRSPATIIPLAFITAFFVYYVIENWSPHVSYAGMIGPFTNPSVFAGAGFIAALGFAVTGRTSAARVIALLASTAELGIAFLAIREGWLGPSLTSAAPIATLGLLTVVPWRSRVAAVVSLLVLIAFPILLLGVDAAGAALGSSSSLRFTLQLPVIGGVLLAVAVAAHRAARLERKLPKALGT